MSLEILHTTTVDPVHSVKSTEYFVPLPDAYDRGILDPSSITPTDITVATRELQSGKMPPSGGIVSSINNASTPNQAFDLVGVQQLNHTSGLIIPLSKSAVDEKDKIIQRGGVVFLTSTEGQYIPVARVYDLRQPSERLEADFLKIPRVAEAIAILALSGFEHGRYEAYDTNTDGATIIKRSIRYF